MAERAPPLESTPEDTRERLAAIGEIAAEVAHELRNALQIIAASAYLARQDPAGAETHIAKIERNAHLAQSIVDDLMSLARGEPAHAEPVLVAELLVGARSEIASGAVEWDDALAPPDVRIRVHPGLFTRVLHALYENAIGVKATRITTRAWLEDGRGILEVSDDGPGVPPDLAPRIFDALVTGRSGGSGLGLALAKRILAAHGGSIALVPSEVGAKFRLELPPS